MKAKYYDTPVETNPADEEVIGYVKVSENEFDCSGNGYCYKNPYKFDFTTDTPLKVKVIYHIDNNTEVTKAYYGAANEKVYAPVEEIQGISE